MHTPALLDFGAAGKGYAADIIAQLLRENGCNEFIIDASGDILRKSSQQTTIRIGLENPLDTTQVLGFCELGNEAICASGVTKRKWQDWHHIVDPTKAQPTTRILATWAIASNCMEADGIATALFMVKPEVISEKHVFDYLILFDDKSARYSPTFPGKVFV